MHERLATLARDLQAEAGSAETLQGIVDAAAEVIGPCEAAGISLARRRSRIDSSAATSDTPVRSDELQAELGEGPCMEAMWLERIVSAPDLALDVLGRDVGDSAAGVGGAPLG